MKYFTKPILFEARTVKNLRIFDAAWDEPYDLWHSLGNIFSMRSKNPVLDTALENSSISHSIEMRISVVEDKTTKKFVSHFPSFEKSNMRGVSSHINVFETNSWDKTLMSIFRQESMLCQRTIALWFRDLTESKKLKRSLKTKSLLSNPSKTFLGDLK